MKKKKNLKTNVHVPEVETTKHFYTPFEIAKQRSSISDLNGRRMPL